MNRKEYVSAVTLGDVEPFDVPNVILALYGPRGGTRGTFELTPSEARQLGEALLKATA